MRVIKNKTAGLALATILLAVALIAAIAVAIGISTRSGNASNSQQQNKLLATTILSEAQQIKNNFEFASSNGVDISTVTASYTSLVTNFLPASDGITAPVAPAGASTNPSSFGWLWHGAGTLVKIMNVGTGAGNYVIEIDPLQQGVCQQINQALFGAPTILTSYAYDWINQMPVDASTDSAVDSKQEGCFYSYRDSRYFYYKVVLVQ